MALGGMALSGGMASTGGMASISVRAAELRLAALSLDDASGHLRRAAECAREAAPPESGGVAGWEISCAALALADAEGALEEAVRGAETIAAELRLAASAYEGAEAAARQAIGAAGGVGAVGLGLGALLVSTGPLGIAGLLGLGALLLGAGLAAPRGAAIWRDQGRPPTPEELLSSPNGSPLLPAIVRAGVEALGGAATPGPWAPLGATPIVRLAMGAAELADQAASGQWGVQTLSPGPKPEPLDGSQGGWSGAPPYVGTGFGIGPGPSTGLAPTASPRLGRPMTAAPVAGGAPTATAQAAQDRADSGRPALPGDAAALADGGAGTAGAEPSSATSGYGELLDRIPPCEADGPQVRITEYVGADGETFHEVLIAGTSDWGLGETENPFDLAGNGASLSGMDSESVAAVQAAMAAAGIEAGDRVVLAGYSQGGLVAAQLAASGDYEVALLVTAGSPIGDIDTSSAGSAVEFVHAEDVVPALEGIRQLDHGSELVVASVGDDPRAQSSLVGAHAQELYVETAHATDDADDARSAELRQEFDSVYGGATLVSSEAYRVTRG
ncbi:hypothetical protein USB125703_00676 [Pseudoclavibacter triregionum]|nr:hypothetical protein USB125703_00676 [Pseudoclavibacter triregionum]